MLRPWRVGDPIETWAVFRYASDSEVGLRAGWPPHASIEESARVIKDVFAVENNWAVTVKARGDEPIGSIAFRPVEEQLASAIHSSRKLDARFGAFLGGGALDVGYWIGRPFWGRGHMTEALSAVLSYAFTKLDAPAVWGAHFTENVGSARVMEKCG